MSDIETLRARVAELEDMLRTAREENRALELQASSACAYLRQVRRYMRPSVARAAIDGMSASVGRCDVMPVYKVDELTQLALRDLGGAQ